jgi:predicted DNA-binding transcriptional regulator YafY
MKSSRIPKRAKGAGRPSGHFTQFRRLEGMRELLEDRPGGVTIEELAGALRVTTRSVRRYLAEMQSELSLEPVPTRPGGVKLWRITPSEKGRSISLRRTQAVLLFAVRGSFEALRGSALFDEIDVALRELLHLAQRPLRSVQGPGVREGQRFEERVVFAQPPARTYAQKAGELDDLFRAVAELREVTLKYRAPVTDRVQRIVCYPLALVVDRGDVRCLVTEEGSDRVRVLELERIEATEVSTGHFALPAAFDPNEHLHPVCGVLGKPDKRRALIEIDASEAGSIRARKLHPSQRLATAADGRVRVSLPVGEVRALARWVLSMGGAARAIEPVDLVLAVREMSELSRKRHG